MVLLLAISLLVTPLDEFTDLVRQLQTASEDRQSYPESQLRQISTKKQIPLFLAAMAQGPERCRPPFARLLRDLNATQALQSIANKYDYGSRAEVATALKSLGHEQPLRNLLKALPEEKSQKHQRALLYSFYSFYISGEDVVSALVTLLKTEKDSALRSTALYTLSSHSNKSAQDHIWAMAKDSADSLRWHALAALIRRGDADALVQGMTKIEAGEKETISEIYLLMGAIQSLGDRTILPRLRKILDVCKEPLVQRQLIETLVWLKDQKALPQFIELTQSGEEAVALAATDAIMKLSGRNNREIIKKLMTHENADRRVSAAEALLNLDDLSGYDVLEKEVGTAEGAMRIRLVQVLGARRHPRSIDLLVAMLSQEHDDPKHGVRKELLRALEAMHPYTTFDKSASPSSIREWWKKNRKK